MEISWYSPFGYKRLIVKGRIFDFNSNSAILIGSITSIGLSIRIGAPNDIMNNQCGEEDCNVCL